MNQHKIINALELAAVAYRNAQPQYDDTLLTIIDDKESGVQCYIRRVKNNLNITFRGTDSLLDWKTDFKFCETTFPYGNHHSKIRVHRGFLEAYKHPNVRDVIHAHVKDNISSITIYGHSYGAALSVLCAVDIEYNFPDKDIEVIVFGCPRVGNHAFMKSYNKRVFKTIRVENGNDIVTKVPFASWGYRHVGTKLHVGAPRIFGLVSFHAHYPHEYYSSLLSSILIN